MIVHRIAAGVKVLTPAKLNLFFEVLSRRNDGFHEIETLMCPIDLYDTLLFLEDPSGRLELKCEAVLGFGGRHRAESEPVESKHTESGSAELGDLPEGRDNLVMQAAELLRQRAGVSSGARMQLFKRIPSAAGLGGGSSDAAAALVAANEAWRLGWSLDQLARVAAELGSDVPFFLVGGSAACRGRGERIEPIGTAGILHFVVARPPGGLSTADVYGACKPSESPRDIRPLSEALSKGDTNRVAPLLFNRLQSAAAGLSPWIGKLQHGFAKEDVLGHGMSGSGTAYFGLCRHANHARRVARRLEAKGAGSVFVVRSCR